MTWRAGFASVDITPPVGGTSPKGDGTGLRVVEAVWLPLQARVALFDDGARRCAFVALDLGTLLPETDRRLRAVVADVAELDAADVVISCTHTHNGPSTTPVFGIPVDTAYLALLESRLPSAVREAVTSLEPVVLAHGTTETEGLTFNRRPVYVGEEVRTHGPMWIPEYLRLEGPADGQVQVVIASREDGSVVGGMVNFSCHPHMTLSEPIYSADFAGALARKLDDRHGGLFLFLQGAQGNLSWHDMSEPGPPFDPGGRVAPWGLVPVSDAPDRVERWSDALVTAAETAMSGSQQVPLGIRSARRELTIEQRRPSSEVIDLAFWYLAQEPGSVDDDDYNLRATGHTHTFFTNAALQAQFSRDVIALDGLQRLGFAATPHDRLEVSAHLLGDVAFTAYPAEMFAEFGLRTKAESPFPRTIVCGLANGWFGYVPTQDSFDRGGYETRLANSSRLDVAAGDAMTDVALDLLRGLGRN
jgi:hypothetical protein